MLKCFIKRLSLSTRDHNAGAVDPGCFMVYNRFKFHGFITNNKCKLFLRALSFTYCTSEVTLTLASRLQKPLSLSDRTVQNAPPSSFTCALYVPQRLIFCSKYYWRKAINADISSYLHLSRDNSNIQESFSHL